MNTEINKFTTEEEYSKKIEDFRAEQKEILSIAKELNSHIFLGKYFVDPDKTFVPLIQKIIKIYENSELFKEMNINEQMYLHYKSKYIESSYIIQGLNEEKEKLKTQIKKESTEEEEQNKNETSFNYSNDNFSEAQKQLINLEAELDLANEPKVSIVELEKLKEDYLLLFQEKNFLEAELQSSSNLNEKYVKEIDNFLEIVETNEKIEKELNEKKEENETLIEQMKKISNEKEQIHQELLKLQKKYFALENSSKEIISSKDKTLSKIKSLEKEVSVLKQTNETNKAKISSLQDEIQKQKESRKKIINNLNLEIENLTIENEKLQKENSKISKENIHSFIENSAKSDLVKFSYNKEKDSIEIKYDNEIINEIPNKEDKEEEEEVEQENSVIIIEAEDAEDEEESKESPIKKADTRKFLRRCSCIQTHNKLDSLQQLLSGNDVSDQEDNDDNKSQDLNNLSYTPEFFLSRAGTNFTDPGFNANVSTNNEKSNFIFAKPKEVKAFSLCQNENFFFEGNNNKLNIENIKIDNNNNNKDEEKELEFFEDEEDLIFTNEEIFDGKLI